jgi:Tol biopolymer transport system component
MRPFWSPDSRSIGFFAPTSLRRVDTGGGQSRELAVSSSTSPGGGSWNANDVILYAPSGTSPLLRLSASGGEPVPATQLDTAQLGHVSPVFLPDGRRFLYQAGGSSNQTGIYLGSLDGKVPPVRISDSGTLGSYLRSGSIIIARDKTLVAQHLDADGARLVGEPVTLGDVSGSLSVMSGAPLGAVTASANGLIAYRTLAGRTRQLRWFDRTGRMLGTFGELNGTMGNPRISPDGHRVAVDLTVAGNEDIWVLDGTHATRLTFDPQGDARPLWSPDGRDIIFYSLRSGKVDLYRKSSQGVDKETSALEGGPGGDRVRVATGYSPDGRYLLYFRASESTGTDLYVARMDGARKPMALMATPFNEYWGVFSPDGRWIAYASNETGRNEVYVMPFRPPDAAGAGADTTASQARWQISAAGGTFPTWRRDGKELYFTSPAGDMMAAQITSSTTSVVSGVPLKLFTPAIFGAGIEAAQGRQYDVAPDGRFLVNVVLDSGPVSPITLIQNWNPDAGK